MHITVETKQFKEVLETVARVTTKHITLPILQCVLLDAREGTLTLTATNLDVGIRGTLSARVDTDGVIAVPAHLLVSTLSYIPDKEITLSTTDTTLTLETKKSKTDIKGVPSDDFPHIPEVAGTTVTVNGSQFSYGIKTTSFAASLSSIKPELGSIYIFQKKEHSLTFVATDSFRLIEKTVPDTHVVLQNPLLIPWKNALELARITEATNEPVSLIVGENQCAITMKNLYITSRLVSGNFPDYEQIIPKEYPTTATTLTEDLKNALKKTSIFLNKFMQLTFILDAGGITLSAQSGDAGTTTETISGSVEGGDIRLNFNQRYIADILTHVSDDSIILKCAGVGRPMVIENAHDKSLRYLVMPMNK